MQQSIWKRCLILVAFVCLMPGWVWAQEDGLAARRLATEGWKKAATNVFQRTLEDGTVETVSWGLEGVAWELDRVRERIAELEALSLELEEPSSELMDSLSSYQSRAVELEAELRGETGSRAPLEPKSGELRSLADAANCVLVITTEVYAYPTTTGPAAHATAAFSDSCGRFGQVMAEAKAEGIYNGAYRFAYERDPVSGRRSGYGSASASASASVVATSNCWSEAIARVWVTDNNGNLAPFVKRATNDKCRITLPFPDPCLPGLAPCEQIP